MDYINVLQKDKILKSLINNYEIIELVPKKNIYLSLIRSIISQQLSVKVASIIFERFLNLFGKPEPSLKEIKNIDFETLKSIGLSKQKTNYILNIVDFFEDNKIQDSNLNKMHSVDLINYLTQIKGVGRWTVEMILIFALAKEDVFSIDDLGIQLSMQSLYNIKAANKKLLKEEMVRISKKWHPYESYACLYLWQWKNNNK